MAVADLEEINMASYNVALEIQIESSPAVIANLFLGDKHRHFHRHRHGIVDEHEPLQGPVAPLVIECRRQYQSREARRMVLLSRHRWMDLGGEFGGAMLGRLKEIVREVGFDAREIVR